MPTPAAAPTAISHVLERIENEGASVHLVGACVRSLLAMQRPETFEAIACAPLPTLLRVLPRATIGAHERQLHVPTPDGPLDLWVRAPRASLESHLADRDFTVHAMAWRPATDEFFDPFGGHSDLAARRLRSVGAPAAMLHRDPLRIVRAFRIATDLRLEIDAPLFSALTAEANHLARSRGPQLRRELDALLTLDRAGDALRTLRRAGLEVPLVGRVHEDGPEVIDSVGHDLDLRWCAWLRGAPRRDVFRRFKVPRDRSARIERWLQLHPVDDGAPRSLPGRARRLLRGDPKDLEALLTLRRAELGQDAAGSDASLSAFLDAIERQRTSDAETHRRSTLALDGRAIMQHLGCGPGAAVGQALQHLTHCTNADPSVNEPDALFGLLDQWWAERSAPNG